MKNIIKTNFLMLLLSILLPAANNAMAMECYEKSPNYIKSGDDYFNIEDEKKLTDQEKTALNTLLVKAQGKWKGYSQVMECKGPDKRPVREIKKYDVEAKTSLSSGGDFVIYLDKFFEQDNIRKVQTIDLFKGVRFFDFNIKNNGFDFSEKYRKGIINGKTRLVEYIREMSIQNKSLVLKQSLFVNGIFVSEDTVVLSAI